ncbi:hypothetical protein LTR37_018880 [Vermiconidia calcicola]|uniref:Uncharacterized protein n=1 Tax=Vermiconidia calcicola TaxID=1690605 RepID=A0ACC3MFZ1_9PEZI|nr:hypothetical protein LTR37_018880 [Vermiconidia calcicola]
MDDNHDEALKRKRELYAGMDSSTHSEDDEAPDPGRAASIQALQKAAARKHSKGSNGLARSVSDSKLAESQRPPPPAPSRIDTRPLPTSSAGNVRLPTSLMTRQTFSGTGSKSIANVVPSSVSKATAKRKRESSTNQAPPKEQQLFSGLHFYFFPNTDKHPARKMRIAKAIDFGATWEREFNDQVTHIIVDKAMDFGLLTKFLKQDNLPSKVAVVSEKYPAECLSFRAILDPQQLQFKVKGYEPPATKPATARLQNSPPLKIAGRSVMARHPETPPTSTERERVPTPPAAFPTDESEAADVASTASHARESTSSNVQSTEELDVAIRKARELQHVPLDNDDEPVSRPTSSDGPGTDDEEQQQSTGLILMKKKKTKMQRIQDRFQCMGKHTGSKTETPNAATIMILQQMADYYGQIGDEWRLRAYRKAIATLRNHPTKVWTKNEALGLPQIGDRLATKIEEIAFTNRLRRLENAQAEPDDQILQTFMQVYGAGFAQASKWVNVGYTTLDELLEKAQLTENQRIGIEHYEDFNSRIPRAEVEQHGQVVRKTLRKIDPAFEVIVGGSYRRGSDTSGDIDCVITRPDTGIAHIRQVVLDQLVPKLVERNFLVAELAATSREDGSKWHGASQLSSDSKTVSRPWRRLDFLLVPSEELGAALIYFTGNDIFNRSLRLLAGTKGMRLNQRGLYKDVIRGKGREKLSEGTLVEGKDEKKIFEMLGVPWRPPEHRIC